MAITPQVVRLDAKRAERTGDTLGLVRPRRGVDSEVPGDAVGANAKTGTAAPTLDRGAVVSLPARRRSAAFAVALAASLLLHAAPIAYFGWPKTETTLGAGGQELDAVSVEMISAAALESLVVQPAANAKGAAQSSDMPPGMEIPIEQAEVAATAPPPELETKQAEALVKPDPIPATESDLVAAPIITPAPVRDPTPEPKTVDEKPPEPDVAKDEQPSAAQPAIVAGGASSRAQSESVDQEGAAGASAGQLARYAVLVRIAVGKVRPRHSGGKGRVQVSFALTEDGGLRNVEISDSSGKAGLDQAALEAVRRAAFPRPPAGTTDKQRTYVVPFDFK
ncbi:MAG: energy transducer TonB [Hyphomicrobiaceae bacterium]